VEDGRPFCPQCRAPQISVRIAVPEPAIRLNAAPDEASDRDLQERSPDAPTSAPGLMDRGIAVRAALKAGVLGIFVGMIPILGIALTGALGVFFYRRGNGPTLPAALAARLGGAAGVVAFAINSLMITVRIFVFHAQQEYIDAILKIAQSFGANVADPEIQASVHNLFTPAGLAVTFFFGMIFTVALASIGGALASLFMRPSVKRR
jgi:hypothetical protein